jgi:hypothetical protein
MSFNIVDLIKDQISDQVLGQLGGVLGADTENTSGALAGALPGLLGGLTNAASSPSGAGALFNAVQDQDDGLLGNIGNLLGSDQASSIGSNGTSLLTSLLGDGALGQLAGVIASVAGVSRGNSSSLIGMLAPLIIGVLKKTVLDGGLNAGSLSAMLAGQSNNVSAAMPQGFSSQLQSAGFFDSIAPEALSALSSPTAAVASAATAATAAPVAAAQAAVSTATESSSSGGFMKWILPLVAIAGIAWFGMQYMNKQAAGDAAAAAEAAAQVAAEKAEATAQAAADKAEAVKAQASEAADSAAAALTAAQESMPAGVDLEKISGGLDGVFGSASEALSGITDLESAKNAIPSLTEAAGDLGGINDVIARLPDAAKGPLASIVQGGIGMLQPLIDKISAIPGVGAIIEPVVAPIMEMLNGMAG